MADAVPSRLLILAALVLAILNHNVRVLLDAVATLDARDATTVIGRMQIAC